MSWQAPHCLCLTNAQSAGTRISTLFYTLPPIQKATPTWPQPALKADQLSSYFFRGQKRLTKNIYKRDAEQWRSPFAWRERSAHPNPAFVQANLANASMH